MIIRQETSLDLKLYHINYSRISPDSVNRFLNDHYEGFITLGSSTVLNKTYSDEEMRLVVVYSWHLAVWSPCQLCSTPGTAGAAQLPQAELVGLLLYSYSFYFYGFNFNLPYSYFLISRLIILYRGLIWALVCSGLYLLPTIISDPSDHLLSRYGVT